MGIMYTWLGHTTQRDSKMLRPGQTFDGDDFPMLDIDAEIERGRVQAPDKGPAEYTASIPLAQTAVKPKAKTRKVSGKKSRVKKKTK